MDDERVTAEAAGGEGICVECGGPIPRERLETLVDVFRCGECTRSDDAAGGPAQTDRLRQTA